MKFKRRITAIIVLTVLVAALVITAVASESESTGTVEVAQAMLGTAVSKTDPSKRADALDELVEYLKTIDGNSEGLDELYLDVDKAELDAAKLLLAEVKNDMTEADKNTALVTVASFLDRHPMPDTTEGYTEFKESLIAKYKELVDYYINQAKTTANAADKHKNLDSLAAFVGKVNYTLTQENETDIADAGLAAAVLYISAVDTSADNVACGKAIRTLESFLNDHAITKTGDTYTEFMTGYTKKKSAFEQKLQDSMNELSNSVSADCFPFSSTHELTFDKDAEKGIITPENHVINDETYAKIEKGMDGDNSYFTLRYPVTGKHVRINADLTSITDYAVVEFDFTTFSSLPSREIWIEDGTTMLLKISTAGSLIGVNNDQPSDKKNQTLAEGIVIKGEWVHISMVINVKMSTLDVYVDYKKVGEALSLKSTSGHFYTPNQLRIGANPNTSAGGEFSIDNFYMYKATAPMNVAAVSEMTEDELFVYCVNRLYDEGLPKRTRYSFYKKAGKLLPTYYDGENDAYVGTLSSDVKSAVDDYNDFDYSSFSPLLSAEALTFMEKEIDTLTGYSKGESTNSIRNLYLDRCKTLLKEIDAEIDKNHEASLQRYSVINEHINRVTEELRRESMANEFVSYVNNFFAAIDISTKQEYCDLALERLDTFRLADFNYLVDEELFPAFCKAYEDSKTLEDTLADLECLDRSKLLFSCLTFLKDYPTEKEWIAEFDYLSIFVTQANSIIESGNYDPYYRNLSGMIEEYEPIRNYFYLTMQKSHIAFFEAELDKFNATEHFFERYAIAESLKTYVNNNDIDYTNERLVALIEENSRNYSLLYEQKDGYVNVIAENTERFIEICDGFLGPVDYVTMKQAYTQALKYFHLMDVSDVRVQNAIAIFKTRREEIDAIEAYANEFIISTARLAGVKYDSLDAIIECSAYLDRLNTGVKGVNEAVAKLNAAMADYNAEIAKSNLEIASTQSAAMALVNTEKTNGIMALVSLIFAR